MAEIYKIVELEIVGYANALTRETVPRIVAPIYRSRSEPQCLVFPPYSLGENCVVDAHTGNEADLEQAIHRGSATAIEQPIAAAPGHELWVDEEMTPQYERSLDVRRTLHSKAMAWASEARQLLQQGKLDEADAACRKAQTADDSMAETLALRAAISRLGGDESRVNTFRTLAEPLLTPAAFDFLVDQAICLAGVATVEQAVPEVVAAQGKPVQIGMELTRRLRELAHYLSLTLRDVMREVSKTQDMLNWHRYAIGNVQNCAREWEEYIESIAPGLDKSTGPFQDFCRLIGDIDRPLQMFDDEKYDIPARFDLAAGPLYRIIDEARGLPGRLAEIAAG